MHPLPTNLIRRRILLIFFGIQVPAVMVLVCYHFIFHAPPYVIITELIALLIVGVLSITYRHNWKYARQSLVISTTLMTVLFMPEPYISERFSIAALIPPVLALCFTDSRWVLGSAIVTYVGLLVQEQGARAYADPATILLYALAVGGLILSRELMSIDQREAEQNAALLADERASLSRRVSERTAELSAANAELARTSRLKDEFLASMSHELRTPLSAILGITEALREEMYGPVTPLQSEKLQTVERSGRHLLTLINDILDLAKAEAGKLMLDYGPVSVRHACESSLQLIVKEAERKDLRVTLDLDPCVTIMHADRRRLVQILVNLLSNAVKFTPAGGSIGLEVRGDALKEEYVYFTVWDTGIGIEPHDLARLFQPFVQLDSSLTRQYGGTGLGLALVYRMVQMHKGSVTIDSTPGMGSRFTVGLPWHETEHSRVEPDPPAVSPAALNAAPPPIPAATILLAEDNEDTIATISEYLICKGYNVLIAHNGLEAVAYTRLILPDLVLMDIQMPGMNGLEVLALLRSLPALANTPIIALTALAMPDDRERCLTAGADAYVSKPVSLRLLAETVEQHLLNTRAVAK